MRATRARQVAAPAASSPTWRALGPTPIPHQRPGCQQWARAAWPRKPRTPAFQRLEHPQLLSV
jgi:hypothetical protein